MGGKQILLGSRKLALNLGQKGTSFLVPGNVCGKLPLNGAGVSKPGFSKFPHLVTFPFHSLPVKRSVSEPSGRGFLRCLPGTVLSLG